MKHELIGKATYAEIEMYAPVSPEMGGMPDKVL